MFKNPLADAVVALTTLQPEATDDESRRKIVGPLGLIWRDAQSPSPTVGPVSPAPAPPLSSDTLPKTGVRPESPAVRATPATDLRPMPFNLRSSAPVARQAPEWLGQVELFPKPQSAPARSGPIEPLFRPDWTRGILSGALAVMRADGPVDLPEVVDRICRGEAITAVPRRRWATLSRGVQLLIDRGEGMAPFSADQASLESRLRMILGDHALEVLAFSSCPDRKAGRGPKGSWQPYRKLPPPRAGTTIVALTDLGVPAVRLRERQASPEEWVEFAKYVRSMGCPLVALVPYPRTRVPEAVHRYMTVLPWDRRTSASRVRSLVGMGLK